ncbi:uncharacterized protein SETTUDRAFT_24688 [Exserohilum turcica Et28A]|uniref:Uncharacterized protein n=1 Tax=Exserohilum turcicum (strain 28A) TaxID=671987 RepID=R0JUL4_EXST2|nr:uncharacterized protein SETTUDRAFT_24688 [Exserohilum turcica Et28A]EOA81184.1 hypothetical protein SETTUDRAFT_24688 [Exserohilum turcica Et28A]
MSAAAAAAAAASVALGLHWALAPIDRRRMQNAEAQAAQGLTRPPPGTRPAVSLAVVNRGPYACESGEWRESPGTRVAEGRDAVQRVRARVRECESAPMASSCSTHTAVYSGLPLTRPSPSAASRRAPGGLRLKTQRSSGTALPLAPTSPPALPLAAA